jgi:alpha-beta hydrolase superfamily lysophospholipase
MLLRSASFSKGMPAGTRAWRIAYTTTRSNDTPAVASAVVLMSSAPPSGPRPVIAWAHGTTGIEPGCAPSLMARPLANVPAVDGIIREGWVYVATDYAGLGTSGGHAYLIGEDAARSVLDAVRAARQLKELTLDERVVVWGHSQGGHSALWTGISAPTYAPDVRVAGVAAAAPASDLTMLLSSSASSPFRKITMSYLLHAYSAFYPDVRIDDYVRPGTRLVVADLAGRCVGEWPTLLSVFQATLMPGEGIFSRSPTSGALGTRLSENSPQQPISVPVLIAQGRNDDLVLPAVQDSYVAARCAAGQPIDYRIYAGLDHLSLVAPSSPLGAELVAWTRDRLVGKAPTSTCRR